MWRLRRLAFEFDFEFDRTGNVLGHEFWIPFAYVIMTNDNRESFGTCSILNLSADESLPESTLRRDWYKVNAGNNVTRDQKMTTTGTTSKKSIRLLCR
jgi:hypothetical protein